VIFLMEAGLLLLEACDDSLATAGAIEYRHFLCLIQMAPLRFVMYNHSLIQGPSFMVTLCLFFLHFTSQQITHYGHDATTGGGTQVDCGVWW